MRLREAGPADAAALAHVFWRSVREGAVAYDVAQRAAWLSRPLSAAEMTTRIAGLETFLAEDDEVLGFMSLRREDGYLDLAFVLPEWRGRGVADRLYERLEDRARGQGLSRLWSHASLMARPFFARYGWQVLRPDPVDRQDVVLERFEMEKQLGSPDV